ncbi:MAG: hypothetical protein KGL40_02310 [Rhodocyclaceae bacterium]|nr:hypothetical protein [Rhodocyclaceae bacterium]
MDKPFIRTAQDLRKLPNYLESVDPQAQPLSKILVGYFLETEHLCGLKSCHQPHKEGFLVELENGKLTNVGWKCGERFGDRFALERTKYAERELRPKAIRTIQDAMAKIRAMKEELATLASDADRLSQCKQGMRNQLPKLYKELDRRAHSGNAQVVEQVERTKQEIDNLYEMNPGAGRERFRYREEARGILPGLHVISDNIRENVIVQLTGKAETLLTADIGPLSTDKLLDWERWALRFDSMVERAHATVKGGTQLFSPESFRLMSYLTTVHTERSALSKLTSEALLKDVAAPKDAGKPTAEPLKLSKKQQDIQKRLEATLRNAKRLGY